MINRPSCSPLKISKLTYVLSMSPVFNTLPLSPCRPLSMQRGFTRAPYPAVKRSAVVCPSKHIALAALLLAVSRAEYNLFTEKCIILLIYTYADYTHVSPFAESRKSSIYGTGIFLNERGHISKKTKNEGKQFFCSR